MTQHLHATEKKSGSTRSILILGASRYQLEVIGAARTLGLRVVTVDNVPSNPGHALADRAYFVDTTAETEVLGVAENEHVSAVIAACTDVAVPTAALVAERLGLPGIPVNAARVLTSKLEFRCFQRKSALATMEFAEATEPLGQDARTLLEAGACVVKPDRSSGSKGIFIVNSVREFAECVGEAKRYSLNGKAIVERFLWGSQGTCEGLAFGGAVRFACFTDRATVPPPHTATAAHFVPSNFSVAQKRGVLDSIEAVFALTGIRNTPFDCDFVVHEGRPYVIELTPRLGGNSLSKLIRAAYGLDMAACGVGLACGEDLTSMPVPQLVRPTAEVILGVEREGRLAYDEAALAALRQQPWLVELNMDYPAGAHVQPFRNGRDRVGEATLVAESRQKLDELVASLRVRLGLKVVDV